MKYYFFALVFSICIACVFFPFSLDIQEALDDSSFCFYITSHDPVWLKANTMSELADFNGNANRNGWAFSSAELIAMTSTQPLPEFTLIEHVMFFRCCVFGRILCQRVFSSQYSQPLFR